MSQTPLTCVGPDGRTLSWAEFGDPDGVPVLFLHGTPGSRLNPTVLDGLYARMGARIVAPDRAGYGRTDPLPARRVIDAAADLVTLLDVLEVPSCLVVGGSGGGPHALGLGVAAPTRVRAVGVLVGAAPLLAEEIRGQVALNQEVMALLGQTEALDAKLSAAADVLLSQGMSALAPDASESDRVMWASRAESMRQMVAAGVERGVNGWVEDYEAIWGSPWGFEPSDVSVPVVWAHGDADHNVPIAAARRLARGLPDCRFLTWPEVGHAPGPDLFAEFFAALFARVCAV
ncbi:MAG TPA: alpha/beta hydrolase [Mycobacteriales bacterium]|nr:alpha/beta hydrolase [Mycobacteriales bacterium]